MSKLERKWWFVALLGGCTGFLTSALMTAVGIRPSNGIAEALVFFLCFSAIWRGLSLLAKAVLLFAAPSSALLDRG